MGQLGPLQLVSAEFEIDEQWMRSGTRVYMGAFDPASDEVYVIRNAAFSPGGTPFQVGQQHPSDTGAKVKSIRASLKVEEPAVYTQTDQDGEAVANSNNGSGCYYWLVTVGFGPWNPLEHNDGSALNKPAEVEWEPYTEEIPLYQDVNTDDDGNGTPILTSAGNYFDPPVMGEDLHHILHVYRNEPASFDYVTAMGYSNKLNESPWNGFDAKTVKLDPLRVPRPVLDQQSNALYYPMEYVFRIRLDTWQKRVIDQDYSALDPSNPAGRRAILVDGVPASSPVLLDGSGNPLVPPISPEQIYVWAWDIYKTADYTYFGMDDILTLPTP